MSGIIFFKTENRQKLQEFYISQIGMELWLDQGGCVLLRHGNMIIGFCDRDSVDTEGMITFFYDTRDEVDVMYQKLKLISDAKPVVNDRYRIYHFFARDPDGRAIEFQSFLHPLPSYLSGHELLTGRRSIRQYTDDEVTSDVITELIESCRFAPSAMNSQPWYFIIIRDRDKIKRVADLRGNSSQPIAKAPIAVAICTDPGLSRRFEQDGAIAAYHFMLSAKLHGLGTCWIGGMDRSEVKQILDIPEEHHVVTVTPLGYPAERPIPSHRKGVAEILR